MASAPPPPTDADVAEAPPQAGGKKLIIIGALAGLVIGFGVGGFVLAPKMGHAADGPAVVEEEAAPEDEGTAVASVHSVENLVINPANTNGQRFLLITTSIVVKDAATIAEVAGRDAEVRDRIVDFLGGKSVEELGDPTKREALRTDLAAAVGGLFKEGTVKRVLLPQFVIQ